jgi:hypothetical protein
MTNETLPEGVSPEGLTLALRREGALGEGRATACPCCGTS